MDARVTGGRRRLATGAWLLVLISSGVAGCAPATSGVALASSPVQPGRTVNQTLERAIGLLERHECAAFAVDFLSPIRRAAIEDLDAFRRERSCTPDDRGNLDDVLLALRMALGAVPELRGVRATFDLSGVGLKIERIELVRYVDGRWYFNGF